MTNVMEMVGKVVKVKVFGDAFTGRKTKERKLQADKEGNIYIEYKGTNYPVEFVEAEDKFQVIGFQDTAPKAPSFKFSAAYIVKAVKAFAMATGVELKAKEVTKIANTIIDEYGLKEKSKEETDFVLDNVGAMEKAFNAVKTPVEQSA